ncbi:MAG: RpoL/Rpb11 RNA polymerase subunit family protein [Nitrososphaeria archaeon]
MEVSVIKKDDKSLELLIKDIDISLMYILQLNLLNDKRVKNVSVKKGHPLTREAYIYLLTDGSDPKSVMNDGIDKATEITKSLKNELEKALS